MLRRYSTAATTAALLVCSAGPALAQSAGFVPSADAIRAHMEFLSSDLMEGRAPGTRGYDLAASYVAARFRELGLKPAGDPGSYLQKTPLVEYRSAAQGRMVLKGQGRTLRLAFGEDYLPQADPLSPKTRLAAPMVFVGYGVVAPERGRDDYAGLDVRGKVVVLLNGAPRSFQTEERAHYGGGRVKRAAAQARGAAAVVFVDTPTNERMRPFAKAVPHWSDPRMTWRAPDGQPFTVAPAVTPLASISLKGAAKLFAGAPQSLEAVMAAAEAPEGDPPRFVLPWTLEAMTETVIGAADSANVAGLVEGGDPTLKDEVIVLSAHLDHEGVGTAVNGDAIYNGAMDNASGIATLLEVARGFTSTGVRPKRSILFLAVTAEEKGLIGAEYFARNPTVPKTAIAANVNLDMPVLNYDFTDVVAFGAERSTIGPAVARAAERVGLKLAADPMPDEGLFTRSDHYRFVEQGIPSVFLMTGPSNGGREAFAAFLATRYHQPNDDMSQPVNFEAGARFVRVNFEIARELADQPVRPRWNDGDFFGRLFGGR